MLKLINVPSLKVIGIFFPCVVSTVFSWILCRCSFFTFFEFWTQFYLSAKRDKTWSLPRSRRAHKTCFIIFFLVFLAFFCLSQFCFLGKKHSTCLLHGAWQTFQTKRKIPNHPNRKNIQNTPKINAEKQMLRVRR